MAERTRVALSSPAVDRILGVKAALAVAGVVLGAITAKGPRMFFGAAILGVGGWRWPEFRLARRDESRRRAVLEELPDALAVLAASVRAGASIARAFGIVAERERGPLGEAMRDAVAALDHGLPKDRAYELLFERADAPEVRTVVTSLRRAERLGTSVAATLDALAQDMRERRRAKAEESARSAPVRMLFPVIVCFLPAFVILAIAPVLIVALRGFRGV